MPSMPHDGPVELVRQCPDMAVDFVRAVGGIKLPHEVTAELAPTDMSAAVPGHRRERRRPLPHDYRYPEGGV